MNVTEEQLRDIIEEFDDWVWCNCSDCRTWYNSHAVSRDASLEKLADFVINEIKNRDNNDTIKT